MTLLAIYEIPANFTDPTPHTVDVTGAIRLGSIAGLVDEAELGAVGEGNIILDDPDSDVGYLGDGIVGLKRFLFDETACPAGSLRVWTGWVGDRRYHRGEGNSLILEVAREIDVTLVDENALLTFRVFAPFELEPDWSFDRPAETDIERITALLAVDFVATSLFDVGYVNTSGPVAMDANDYTGSTINEVLNDCAQQSGKNFFVMWNPDESDPKNVLWYDRYTSDGTSTIVFDSPLRLCNIEALHDGETTFAIYPDAVTTLDPSRVMAGVYLPFTGGTTYRKDTDTADAFAYRDQVADSATVKTIAKANARADRYLNENDTETNRITCTVRVPNTHVTRIKAGMRIEAWFTHLPAVNGGFTWCRILQRTVRQDVETEVFYWLDLELTPLPFICPDVTADGFYPPNLVNEGTPGVGHMTANGTGNCFYRRPGIASPEVPTPGALGVWHFSLYNQDGGTTDYAGDCVQDRARCLVIGAGTMTIHTAEFTGHARTLSATLQHRIPGGGIVTDSISTGNPAGDDIVVVVDTHDDEFCAHWVDVHDEPSGCGSKWGFMGFDWVGS